ncbi:DUF6340 family protein [Thermodesulfobacteriota bacterium]
MLKCIKVRFGNNRLQNWAGRIHIGMLLLFLVAMGISLVKCGTPKAVIITREYPPKIRIVNISSLSVLDETCQGDRKFKAMLIGKLKQKISAADFFKLDPDGEDAWIWFNINEFYLRQEVQSDGGKMKVAFALVEFSIRWAEDKKVFSIQRDTMRSRESQDYDMLDSLAESIVKEFAGQVVPIKKRELRYFASGGSNANTKGVNFAMAENWELAMKSWKEAVSLDPNDHRAIYNLGVGYEQRNDIQSAYEQYTEAAIMKPDETLYSKASAQAKKDADDQALIDKRRNEIQKLDDL